MTAAYLVKILVGTAIETVQSRPPSEGVNCADGLKEVVSGCALWPVLRFYDIVSLPIDSQERSQAYFVISFVIRHLG